MTQPSPTELGFDIETLRIDATATLSALCARFEPEHARGLDLLLGAAEFVQRTVIGPPEADARPHLAGAAPVLPYGCIELFGYSDVTNLAALLTELGWPTTDEVIWEDDGENSFASAARTVVAIRLERSMRVAVASPDRRPPRSALIERGQYLACASGERLFFTEALCRLPLDRNAGELDPTAIPGFWVEAVTAACGTCHTSWMVDPSGDLRPPYTASGATAWNFFEEAADLAYISNTFACPDLKCEGRAAFALA